ncbi:MAG: hypothetical protein K0R34_3947 [Herbinix sp.]|jgi:hypothetical protein|nr:hypothetical protein [Herbinix sp.]
MEKKKWIPAITEGILVVLLLAGGVWGYLQIQDRLAEVSSMTDMSASKLVLYEGPKSLKDAMDKDLKTVNEMGRDFSLMHCMDTLVSVNGYESYVYDTNVNHNRVWFSDYLPTQSRTPITYFDFEGIANIVVTVPDIDLKSVKLSPLNYGIEPVIDQEAHTVSFTVTEQDNYTLTFNDSPSRALHIFTNPLETDAPKEGDEGVVYIGPGEWNIDSIMLEDNQTLYIAGGAVVHGVVQSNYTGNIKVMGRGIIDGSTFEGWQGKSALVPIKIDFCDGIELKDVIVLNPNAWVCSASTSKNALIDGIRIISSRPNGDGITLQSCENYTVQNCFVRSWDDSLVVKNYTGDSKNIIFRNNQLWTDLAQSMEIGYETNKGKKENAKLSEITFENITVLNNFHKPVISVHNADDALITDVTFRNIIVENAQMGSGDGDEIPYLIDFNIAQSTNWSTTKERGQIRNVLIDGVKVLSGRFNSSRIQGFDETHTVEDITIRNLEILGEKITGFEQGKFEIDEDSTKNLVIE